jgi:peptide/nickel transport system ATP-binding protein
VTPVLQVEGLRIEIDTSHAPLVAVSDVSFSISPGEVLGVAGESGAGKSVTGTAILGLLEWPFRQTSGRILLNGRRIDDLAENQMRKIRGREIGAVFQDPLTSLNPLLTVGKQLIQTMRTHLPVTIGEARDRAVRLLQEVGIASPLERLASYPHQLSGGMRQRVALALAFACEPILIVADEPTTALDVSVQMQVITLLRRMCSDHRTAILLITHDMGVMAEIADHLAVMYAGHIVELGTAAEILRQSAHPYSQELIACVPSLERHLTQLPQILGAMPGLGALPAGCAFNPRCSRRVERCLVDRPELRPVRDRTVACWVAQGETPALESVKGHSADCH